MTRIYTEWRQVKVKREDKGNLQFLLKKNKGFMDTSLLKSLMLNIKCIIISPKTLRLEKWTRLLLPYPFRH